MLKVNVHEIWSSTVNVVLQCCVIFVCACVCVPRVTKEGTKP